MESNNNILSQIPLPNEKVHLKKGGGPFHSGTLSDIKGLLHSIQLDDILLFGLIILLATDDDCDNFLLIILIIIFIAGLEKQLFPFLPF